jgi:hypothetical protein
MAADLQYFEIHRSGLSGQDITVFGDGDPQFLLRGWSDQGDDADDGWGQHPSAKT